MPVNGWLTAPDAEYCISNAESKILICDQERYERLVGNKPEENVLAPLQRKGLTVILVPDVKPTEAQLRKWREAGVIMWDDVVSGKFIGGKRSDLPNVEVLPEDGATIMYT